MEFFDALVHSRVDGEPKRAKIGRCEACGGLFFGCFQIDGQDHFHLQCAECGISFCPQGDCHLSTVHTFWGETPVGQAAWDAYREPSEPRTD